MPGKAPQPNAAARPAVDLWSFLDILRRRAVLIVSIAGVLLALTLLALLVQTPRYSATSQVVVELRRSNGTAIPDPATIETHVALIRSSEMLARIAQQEAVLGDDEFGAAAVKPS